MSANIDTMMYVGETPWHGLGLKFEKAPETAEEVLRGGSLDWTVSAHVMSSDKGEEHDWHAIYRDDQSIRLGVVNTSNPKLVQNVDTFIPLDPAIKSKDIIVDTAASLARGKQVFGCFRFGKDENILGDKVESYFVVVNNHQEANGKVTVLHTPVRVVCQNTLSSALNNSFFKAKVPITDDNAINDQIFAQLISSRAQGMSSLACKADKLATTKLTQDQVRSIIDDMFPLAVPEDEYDKKNDKIHMRRNTFIEQCLAREDLGNFRGTAWQVYNAFTDYEQHYTNNADKVYDLKYRMSRIPGFSQEALLSQKFLQKVKKYVA